MSTPIDELIFWFARLLILSLIIIFFFFFQAEDGIRDKLVTGVQTCALPIFGEQEVTGEAAEHGDRGGRAPGQVADASTPTLWLRQATGAQHAHDPTVLVLLRSEEHTSELQSLAYLVCRLLLEKKKK